MSGKYNDIIDLPHHESKTRPRMSMLDRAAQFSPFAALTGHDAAIRETARLTEQRVILDECEIEMLNEKLRSIEACLDDQRLVSVTCFKPDEKKSGGAYVTVTGAVKRIDPVEQVIVMGDGMKIPITEIIRLTMN